MQKETAAKRVNDFIQICQEHHLKVTPQRIAIYKVLLDSNPHPTADAVYQSVKKEHPSISFDTVNRTLQTFAKTGIVDVVEIFGGAKRFDLNVTNHHHMHCTQCGKVYDFYHRKYDHLEIPATVREQFQVISKRVVLKGVCKVCREQGK
jgi:Fur family peroxide stress response transcriptional regulator